MRLNCTRRRYDVFACALLPLLATGCRKKAAPAPAPTVMTEPRAVKLPLQAASGFRRVEPAVPISSVYVDDFGVVDFDGDGDLDLYSSNHGTVASLLMNDGTGRFTDVTREAGFHPSPINTNTTALEQIPPRTRPGLYIFYVGQQVRLVAHELPFAIKGRVDSDMNITPVPGSRWKSISTTDTGIEFVIEPGGWLALTQELQGLPLRFDFPDPAHQKYLFAGLHQVQPKSGQFELEQFDRHGCAWADANGDGWMDVLIARGAYKGKLPRLPIKLYQELLYGGKVGFVASPPQPGMLVKGSTRAAAWVDYDGDNQLEAFFTFASYGAPHAPQLIDVQTFTDHAPELGLDRGAESFLWSDVDLDGDPDLLLTNIFYRNDGGRFTSSLLPIPPSGQYRRSLLPNDIDGDGDIDVLVAGTQLTILLNQGGEFVAQRAADVGLPDRCQSATWVDVDNDGWADVHCIPEGLFRRVPGSNGFHATGDFKIDVPWQDLPQIRSQCAWFDMNNDGTRDALCAFPMNQPGVHSDFVLLANETPAARGNHWLELELVGPRGNRQAIGARVEVKVGERRTLQEVGWSENSAQSQGHYRLYFGLGKTNAVDAIEITWPDRRVTRLGPTTADRIVRIEQPKG